MAVFKSHVIFISNRPPSEGRASQVPAEYRKGVNSLTFSSFIISFVDKIFLKKYSSPVSRTLVLQIYFTNDSRT